MKKLFIFLAILFIFQSCRTSGYGCKGTYTWDQAVRRANKLY